MKKQDSKIIDKYVKLKIQQTLNDIKLIEMKRDFYKACARNAVRYAAEKNRVVDLSGSKFKGEVSIHESFTRRMWKYSRFITELDTQCQNLKRQYEFHHKPVVKSKRIWAVEVHQ